MPERTSPDCPSAARSHGTRWAYEKHGCRCPEAREAERRRRAQYSNSPHVIEKRRKERERRSEQRARVRQEKWLNDQEMFDFVKVEKALKGDTAVVLSGLELASAVLTLHSRYEMATHTIADLLVAHYETVTRIIESGHIPAEGRGTRASATRGAE